MAKDALKKLGREELLTLLLEVEEENEKLKEQMAELRAKLDDKMIRIEKCGDLVAAVMELNGVAASVNAACEQYAENVRQQADEKLENCRRMEWETKRKCARMEQETEEKCRRMEREAAERLRRKYPFDIG